MIGVDPNVLEPKKQKSGKSLEVSVSSLVGRAAANDAGNQAQAITSSGGRPARIDSRSQ
jgi:hypothetical protein